MQYAHIKLFSGYKEPLWYTIPSELAHTIVPGSVVLVPLREQKCYGLVTQVSSQHPTVPFELKALLALDPMASSPAYQSFLTQVGALYQIPLRALLYRIIHFLHEKEETLEVPAREFVESPLVHLTTEQQAVVDYVQPYIINPSYIPTLIHGVTGSGKTEIYKKLMCSAYAQGKTTVLLLPEVSLAQAFEQRLRKEIGSSYELHGFHSGSTPAQKRRTWEALYQQKPIIIVGVHLPILLPIANLGLIIVDEEHEAGYQEKKHPKINSKTAALIRAQTQHIPIVLGSATPAMSSLYHVKQREWRFFQLKQRFAGTFPTISLVFLSDKKERKDFWITQQLYQAIGDRLKRGEQTLLYINRRGYSFFVQCVECATIVRCHACSVSLTVHENATLSCHYCGYEAPFPKQCAECKKDKFLKKGIGTQQLVTIIQKLFPHARIERADREVTQKKKQWSDIMDRFTKGAIDILVGTQTISKGYDFQNVTLVGIVWADLNLNFPQYNAAETTLQQLIQVAGRSGRTGKPSMVVVQTLSNHPLFAYLNEVDYLQFYHHEMEQRTRVGYPPARALAEIELRSTDEILVTREAQKLTSEIEAVTKALPDRPVVLGPTIPPVHKINHAHIRKIYLKGTSDDELAAVFNAARTENRYRSMISFTPNPL